MLRECIYKNCNLCKQCDGNGRCLQKEIGPYYNLRQYIKYIKHKCIYDCELESCPKCKDVYPQWILDNDSGFCEDCSMKLHHIYRRLFDDKLLLPKFMDRMLELYEDQNKNN